LLVREATRELEHLSRDDITGPHRTE
jgi:hypothetical protein